MRKEQLFLLRLFKIKFKYNLQLKATEKLYHENKSQEEKVALA